MDPAAVRRLFSSRIRSKELVRGKKMKNKKKF